MIAGDVHAAAVHEDVAVVDDLAGCLTGVAETCAVNDIVEAGFEELEEDHTRDAAAKSTAGPVAGLASAV